MDSYSYSEYFKIGNKAQETFVKFMEKEGNTFLAGDRNGKTINIEVIEEICRCSYIEPNKFGRHGPKLLFSKGDNRGYIMPDELFLLNSGDYSYQFYDVKNRTENTLREEYRKLIDYAEIERYSKIKTFISIIIWNKDDKGFDIYVRRVSDILDRDERDRKYVYFNLDLFSKINKKSIKP